MSVESFKKELWETALLESYKGITLAEVITRKPTSVEGKCAHFNSASVSGDLRDYTGTVVYDNIDTTGIDLLYDKKIYKAPVLDDVDAAQLSADVMMPVIDNISYEIKKSIDKALFAEAVLNASVDNVIGSTSAKESVTTAEQAYDLIVDLGTKLDEKDVPTTGRYVIASPAFVNLLAKDKRVIDNAAVLPSGIVQGMEVNGMQIIKTNNAPANQIIALHNQAIGYGKQIDKMEALRLENAFADAIRTLVVYGVKTLQPEGIAVLNYEIA